LVLAHANQRAGDEDEDEDVPPARLVFGAVAGVSDAYAKARAEKMAVKITAMSVHTSRVDVVMPKARVDVRRRVTLWRPRLYP